MTQKLYEAIQDLIFNHPTSQLIPYENFLREASKLMEDYGMLERDFDHLFEEIGIAKAENAAFMNGVGDPEYYDYDDYLEWEYLNSLDKSDSDDLDWKVNLPTDEEQLDLPF